jgi:hypothetical protein
MNFLTVLSFEKAVKSPFLLLFQRGKKWNLPPRIHPKLSSL